MKNDIINGFLKDKTQNNVAIVHRLIDLIKSSDHKFDCSIKWKNLTFALNTDFHHWLCAISVTKKSVGLNFHFGGLLEDPGGLFEAGTSKFLRKLEYRSEEEINDVVVTDFLSQAVNKLQYFKDNWKEIQKTK